MLLIVLPLAYFGASYYNGEDPIANIKSIFNKETTVTKEKKEESTTGTTASQKELDACKRENELLNKRIEDLEALLEQSKKQ